MKTKLEDGAAGDSRGRPKLSSKQMRYADLIVSGYSQAVAWKTAYKHPKATPEDAAENGWRVAQNAGVKDRIAELRKQSGVKVLLSLNDRLSILAEIAQSPGTTPAEKNAKARAIEVYSKISGDQAPDRHELLGPNGGPVQVAATALVGPISRREKLAMIKARRLPENGGPA